jgi:energy-coupling factor transporter ATP-binding protein EcfA2
LVKIDQDDPIVGAHMSRLNDFFRQAYRNLALFPLVEPQEIENFRVEYGKDTLLRLKNAVMNGPENGKVIFAGHRGCGKSTLLARFAREMRDLKYFVVDFSIADMVEMSAVDHINILYSIAIQLLSKATQTPVEIPEAKKQEIIHWLTTTHTTSMTNDLKSQVGATADLKVIIAKLQTESTFREEIKLTYEKRISDLVRKIEEIAHLIKAQTKREVLIIIDDLDKLDWNIVEDIYRNNVNSLFQPKLRILFTIPVSVIRDIDLRTHLRSASGMPIQQMEVAKFFSKLDRHNPEATPNDAKLTLLLEILYKRFPTEAKLEDLIKPEIAEKIVLKSGGVLREMLRIASECCSNCSLKLLEEPENTSVKIDSEILQLALKDLRNEFAASLGENRLKILVTTYDQAEPPDVTDVEFLKLLHGLYLLEYVNDDSWYDVHPIVIDLLLRRQLIAPSRGG